jgi:hypothetical protein
MPLKRLDNVLIVVETTRAFFIDLACGSRASGRSKSPRSLA